MPELSLRQALAVLSKSSPFAVEVEDALPSELDVYKLYLYVETDIERDLRAALGKCRSDNVIFLCGSSGDGKSAISRRVKSEYQEKVSFHLDATHSFNPTEDAIGTLDDVLSQSKVNGRPLIVGINVGMMANYAEGGADSHQDVRVAMTNYLNGDAFSNNYVFLNFEHYQKFHFDFDGVSSPFVQAIFDRLTSATSDNPFYLLAQQLEQRQEDRVLLSNYRMLSDAAVQQIIIEVLLKARLIQDQFLTARTFLDFVFHLLTADDYLHNNIFLNSDNELARNIQAFNPSSLRTKRIDDFILKHHLGLLDNDFESLKKELKEEYGIEKDQKASSLLCCLFILRDKKLKTSFHENFLSDFTDELLKKYAKFWTLHVTYDESLQQRTALKRDFYQDILFKAIRIYVNRNALNPYKKDLMLTSRGNFQISIEVQMHPDFEELVDCKNKFGRPQPLSSFPVYLRIDDIPLGPVWFNANLLDLCIKITRGYRPNKHDKSSVLMLEEIIEDVLRIGTSGKTLWVRGGQQEFKIEEDKLGDISVITG